MPRSGVIGTYSLPPNTNNQAPNTPISSSMFNAFASDVQQTFNDPTPIAYGGTGAATAAAAATALEVVSYAAQQALTPAQQGQARANIGAGILAGFRNKIINGNFDIWQRGTSFTSPGTYTADCWIVAGGGSGAAYTAGRGTYSPNDNGMTYALNMTQTAGTAPIYALQKIEDVRTLAGKNVTLTFWARDAANNPSVAIRIDQEFGAGGSSTVSTIGPTVSITGTHTKYSVTLDLPTIVGKTIGSNSCVSIYIFNSGGSPNTFPSTVFIGRVSLVEGDATDETDPFAPRGIQQELALCRRYFRKASVPSLIGASATSLDGALDVSDMRATPTVSMSAEMNVSDVTTTTFLQSAAQVSLNGASTDGHLRLSFGNFSGLTLNRPYRHQPDSGLVLLDAGL